MKKILTLGTEAKLLSTTAVSTINELGSKLPTEDATVEQHAEHIAEVRKFKGELNKIMKHINRHFVIANTQHLKAKMREHNKKKLSIFDFGIDIEEKE